MADSILSTDDIRGAALPLQARDITQAAALLAVSEAHILAVKTVESDGVGFQDGRPIILYEPHVFSRRTGGRFDIAWPTISYPHWGGRPYPLSQALRYGQLAQAMKLNLTAALESCSWGLFQLMGFNYAACGFASAQAMVRAMCVSEGQQVMAFARFVRAHPPMAAALLRSDWTAFATLYNGPGQAEDYGARIEAAFTQTRATEPRGLA